MLETLLESGARSDRSAGGAIVSVTAHTAIIAAAIFATTRSHVAARNNRDVIHAVYFPPTAPSSPRVQTSVGKELVFRAQLPRPIDLRSINPAIPAMELGDLASPAIDFGPRPIGDAKPTHTPGASGSSSDAPFQADQVERQAAFIAGSGSPRYPEVLRSTGVEGQVVAVFVVNESGQAEADSVRFLRSDNRLFEDAVRAALPRLRFVAAEIGGRKVRQLVQMPFVFTIGR
jgi:protein TonB